MKKKISIYDIETMQEGNKVYFKSKNKIAEVPYMTYEDLEQYIPYKSVADNLELNKTYYLVVENPWEIYGVISLYKGWTFLDSAEYNNRVVIKSAFPDKECNI